MCCIFQPANGCSARHSLVEINFLALKLLFPSQTEENKEKESKAAQKHVKTCNKGGVQLGVTLKRWLTPKSWSTPEGNMFIFFFVCFFTFVDGN